MELNGLYHMDCMDGMAAFPDKFFDLAVVDPPYGIRVARRGSVGSGSFASFGGKRKRTFFPSTQFKPVEWDNAPPTPEYFTELFRVSKNQIIWGGNYFDLPPSSCWLVWNKEINGDFADAELAWTSFKTAVRMFTYMWNGFMQGPTRQVVEKRIHPTQKPVALYSWILKNYAKPGDKILDTHVGSASSLIACHKAGHAFVGFEADANYHASGLERLRAARRQGGLFTGCLSCEM